MPFIIPLTWSLCENIFKRRLICEPLVLSRHAWLWFEIQEGLVDNFHCITVTGHENRKTDTVCGETP